MRTAVNTARQGSPRISGARGRLRGPATPRGRETEGWPGPGSAAVAVLKGQSRNDAAGRQRRRDPQEGSGTRWPDGAGRLERGRGKPVSTRRASCEHLDTRSGDTGHRPGGGRDGAGERGKPRREPRGRGLRGLRGLRCCWGRHASAPAQAPLGGSRCRGLGVWGRRRLPGPLGSWSQRALF